MSINKTENYQLHAWEPQDDFLLSEINENFAKLDARAVQVAFGAYQGDGVNKGQLIELGLTPLAVLVANENGVFDTSYNYFGGLTLQGYPSIMTESRRLLEIVEGGFRVYTESSGAPSNSANRSDTRYYYLAIY